MKLGNSRRFRFERLENRMLLAGQVLVTVINGDLMITGDEADNHVEILARADGTYRITGEDGTVIVASQNADPAVATVSGAHRDVVVEMKDGDDAIEFKAEHTSTLANSPDPTNATLAVRDLIIRMGNGKSSVRIDGGTVKGSASIDLGGAATGVNSAKLLVNGTTIQGNLGISHQNGLVDVGLAQTEVAGSLTLHLHSDKSRVGIRKSTVGKSAELDLGGDDSAAERDDVAISGSNIGGQAVIQTGTGDDLVGLGSDSSITTIIDQIFGTSVDDLLDGPVQINGNLYVSTRGGADQFLLSQVTIGRSAILATGSGDDTIRMDQLAVRQDVNMNTGDGNDRMSVNRLSSKTLNAEFGRGNEDVSISHSHVTKSVNLDGGSGNNQLTLSDNVFPHKKWGIFPKTKFRGFHR